MIQSGKLSLDKIAKIFECYYKMESLARYPYSTNNAEAFQKDESWQQAKNLAKQTADALHEIESIE